MKGMTSHEMFEAVHRALDEVDRRIASGELDGSGRFYTDEELAAGAATGRTKKPSPESESPAA
ncbi:MAG: hypothetical protein WAL75_27660 [Terracidiphilus sp.]